MRFASIRKKNPTWVTYRTWFGSIKRPRSTHGWEKVPDSITCNAAMSPEPTSSKISQFQSGKATLKSSPHSR